MITKFGKRFLTDFIAGNSSFANKQMVFGISNNTEYPVDDTNSRLGFEFYRASVRFGGIDIDTTTSPTKYTVIYTATLPTNISGKINEIGIYPGSRTSKNLFDSKFITDFELPYEWSPTPDIDQSNYRVGDSSLIFTSNGTSAQEYKYSLNGFDLSGYSSLDTISFSYKVNDSNLSSVKVRFYSSDTDYYEVAFIGHSLGNNIKDIALSEMTTVGSPNKSEILTLGVVITPTSAQSSISADGLRINDEDTFDPTYGLIARSVLSNTLEKVLGRETTVEYKLDLDFGV
jgi:hypothetical protein